MGKLKAEFEQFVKGKHPGLEFRPQQQEAILVELNVSSMFYYDMLDKLVKNHFLNTRKLVEEPLT